MNTELRAAVRSRARDRCEYCGMHQDDEPFYRFHVEHIIAQQHGGPTAESNLALACHHCNLHKGPNLSGIDPESGQVVLLFNPREQSWLDHFTRDAAMIVGTTPTGRTRV